MAREIRADEADHRRGGETADAAGAGGHHVERIAEPKDTAALGEQIVERCGQQFLLDRRNRERPLLRRYGPIRSVSRWLPHRFRSRFVLTRSEEHTSELQSPMRISYAVF